MDNFQQSEPKSILPPGAGLALGVGVGAAVGVALSDLGVGLGVGIGLAIAFEAKSNRSLFGSEDQKRRRFMLALGGLAVALIVVIFNFTR